MRVPAFAARPQVASVLAFVLLWQGAGLLGLLTDTIFPTPVGILWAAVEGSREGFLWRDLWASIGLVIPGLLIGSLLGAVVGIVSGRISAVNNTVGPILHIWRALPAVALAPLFIQLFGINDVSRIVIIASGVFFPVWITTHTGAGMLRRSYVDLARNLELSAWSFYKMIVIPSTLPFTVAGVRNGIAMAYIMLFIAEWIGANNGIGYRISIAHIVFRMDLMCLGLLELGVLSFLTDYGFVYTVHRLLPWLEHSQS